MDTRGAYDVRYHNGGARDGQVSVLVCLLCPPDRRPGPFAVAPIHYHHSGDKSGQGRYNRARAIMVKHLHEEHRAALAALNKAGGRAFNAELG